MIIKLDSVTEAYNKPERIDVNHNQGSIITSFDEVLKSAQSVYNVEDSPYDQVIQASELTAEELAELKERYGVSSQPVNAAASTAGTSGGSVNVPENLVEVFQKASETYGISYDLLVSVARAESNFNPKSTSSSGAMGIMQLMPATAKYLGVEDAYDAESNIMGGARYLAEKISEHGSIELGVAAYNAGSGAVRKYGGIPPYEETQNYVKKVLGYMSNASAGNQTAVNQSAAATASQAAAGLDQSAATASQSTDGVAASQSAAVAPEEATISVAGVTMTYSAYQKYMELMNTGVG